VINAGKIIKFRNLDLLAKLENPFTSQ